MWDDDPSDNGLEPEELGRRMYKRGEAPPSPHSDNDDIRHGYDQEARRAATTAAAGGMVAEEQ